MFTIEKETTLLNILSTEFQTLNAKIVDGIKHTAIGIG